MLLFHQDQVKKRMLLYVFLVKKFTHVSFLTKSRSRIVETSSYTTCHTLRIEPLDTPRIMYSIWVTVDSNKYIISINCKIHNNLNIPTISHCSVSSNSFHGQITQKAVHQITGPENKKGAIEHFWEQTTLKT